MAFWSSLTFTDFDDLKAGSRAPDRYPDFGKRLFYVAASDAQDQVVSNQDPYKQIGTAYQQFDMVHKLKWMPTSKISQTVNFQYSTSSDIPRYDQLTIAGEEGPADLRFAEWFYGPQKRLLLSSRTQLLGPNDLYDKALFIAAYQRIGEDRITRRLERLRRIHQNEELDILSLTLDFNKDLGDRWHWSYGASADYNDLESSAFSERRNQTDLKLDQLSRYPDAEAKMSSYGIYTNLLTNWSSRVSSNLGIRYSNVQSSIAYTRRLLNWPDRFFDGIVNQNNALTWGVSLNLLVAEGLHIVASSGSAFRAPNIDDLAKIRVKSGTASTPNPRLEPERSFHNEITISQDIPSQQHSQQVSITGFITRLKNAIIQVPTRLPNGDTTLRYDGEWFRVVSNMNADVGRMWGISINFRYALSNYLSLKASMNYVEGETQANDGTVEPMAHIPPVYGRASLSYELDHWKIEGVFRFNGAKKLKDYSNNSADNLDQATPEGSLAWATYNFYAAYQISPHLRAQLAVENIANVHYRPFASGLSAPGRNVAVSLYATI